MQLNTGPQMSPEAQQLQQSFMNQPDLLQRYYALFNEGKLPPAQLRAFKELLQKAEEQQGQRNMMQAGSMPPQQHQMGQMPGGSSLQAFQRQGGAGQMGVPSPQPGHTSSPRMGQQQQALGAQPPAISSQHLSAMLEDFKKHQQKQQQLEAFLSRSDVPKEKRDQAEAELAKTKSLTWEFQERVKADPQLLRLLQAQANQQQAQRAMAGNQPGLQQAQAQHRQQTASPALGGQQSLPAAMQNPNIARARSPSNLSNTAPTPPGAQSARAGPSGQAGKVLAQQPPPRPGSAAQGSSSGAFNPVVQGSAAIADDISNRVTASRPEPFPNARPTLTQGLAAQPSVSTPAITRPPVSMLPSRHASASAIEASKAELNRIVPRKSLRDIVMTVDPGTTMDEEVEDLLLEIADEFIESVTKHSCALAVHRKSERLEVKDVQLHLDRVWGISIPGFASDDVRQSQARRLNPPATQLARAAAVREAARSRR